MTRTIKQIIQAAGGPKKIAAATQKTARPISSKSVYDWPTIGIPERHWPVLIKLAKSSPEELMRVNAKARASRPLPAKGAKRETDRRAA